MTLNTLYKVIAIVLLTITTASAFIEVNEQWNSSYRKEVQISCFENETFCENLCSKSDRCVIPEAPCSNCIGSTLTMTFFFQEMGRLIQSTFEEVNFYDVQDLLKSNNFVSLSSKSIYNHIDNFNSLGLQRKFRAMCNDGTRYPVVFFDKLKNNEIGKPLFVWCENGFNEVEVNSNIDFNNDFNPQDKNILH